MLFKIYSSIRSLLYMYYVHKIFVSYPFFLIPDFGAAEFDDYYRYFLHLIIFLDYHYYCILFLVWTLLSGQEFI